MNCILRIKIASCIGILALVSQLIAPVLADDELVPAESILDLQLKKTFGITVGLHPPLRNRTSEQFLLSIDGESVRGCSFEQIKKRLSGPLGSSVKVEIGYPNGDIADLIIRREFVVNECQTPNSDPIRILANEFPRMRSSSANLVEAGSNNTDLIARGRCIRAAQECKENAINAISVYINCMLLSQAIGDFDSADRYLGLALDAMKSSPPSPHTGYREKAVVQNLVSLGRSNEAEAVCKYLLLPEPSHVPRLPAAITVLDAYSLIPTKSAQDASRELAENIISGKTHQVVTSFHQDFFWFAQYLESIGWNDQALDQYSKELERLQKTPMDTGFYGPQAIAYCLYSKARLEALLGKPELAERDLEAIKTNYKGMMAKQQAVINRLPEYFPTFTDVEHAQASLRKSSPIAVPPGVISFSNQDPFVNEGSLSFELQFPKALKCFSLIKENKKADAMKVAQELVSAYQNGSAMKVDRPNRQNLFCTCLRIARAFTDHGWYEAADTELVQLEAATKAKLPKIPANDIGWMMIAAERIYNAKVSGSKPAWSLLQDSNPEEGSKSRAVLSWPFRLAVLAMAYHHADEPKRAKVFIDQAIRDLNSSNQSDGVCTNSNNTPEQQAMLFIVAASINAKLSDFQNADNYLDHVFTLRFSLNESLAASLLDLATIYSDSGQTDKAISILENAAGSIPSKDVLRLSAKFDTRLAQLYRKNRQPDKALSLILDVLDKSKDPAPRGEHQMAGELFEQSKNYAEAATHYYEAGRWSGGISNQNREELLRKAIECASKTGNFDKSILSKTYIALCEIVDRKNLNEGLKLREKAVTLLMDTDPEKPKQLSIIAYIKGELARRNSASKTEPTKSADPADKIAVAKQAAELAAKNNSKEASDYWLRLAYAEAEANKIDAAVEHGRKGIEAYQLANAKTHTLYQFLTSGLPSMIARAGSPEKGESLLKKALAKVQSVAGPGSLPAQVQMSHYFDFLVLQQKDYAKADMILDSLLNTNLNQGRYSPPNHDMNICRFGGPFPVESSMEVIGKILTTSKQSVVGKDNHHALRFLEKVLTAETKQFGKDDYRVAITYAEIARVHSAAGDKEKAYAAYTSAIEIMHQYEDMLFVLSNVNPDYYDLLRKLNKQSEIERTEEQKLDDEKNRQERPFGRRSK